MDWDKYRAYRKSLIYEINCFNCSLYVNALMITALQIVCHSTKSAH